MPGIIEPWSQTRIRMEGWTRIALHPESRAEGRSLLNRFRRWYPAEGRGDA